MMRPDDENQLQNPELAALAAAANAADIGADDQAAPGAPGAVQVVPEQSQAEQLGSIIFMIGQAGAMRFPSLANVYTERSARPTVPPSRQLWKNSAGPSMPVKA